tara:strand:+ start:2106 stop:2354 length:249 start_codon:yes stop_codon:yes gene_type:complete
MGNSNNITSYDDVLFYKEYQSIIENISADILALINELDSKIVSNTTQSVPLDIQFDAVPILRRLKDVQKETDLALAHLRSRD